MRTFFLKPKYSFFLRYIVSGSLVALAVPVGALAEHVTGHTTFIPPDRPDTSLIPESDIFSIRDFYDVACAATQWILVFGIIIGAAFVIWGGVHYITSGGDDSKAKDAKGIIRTAIIGIVFLLLAVALVRIVASFFGASGDDFTFDLTC